MIQSSFRGAARFFLLGCISFVGCGSDSASTGALAGGGTHDGVAGARGPNGEAGSSAGGELPNGEGGDLASAGSMGGGGTNGPGGSAGATGADSGTSPEASAPPGDDMAAAAVLNRYQLLDPCQSSYKAVATPGDVCPQDAAVKNQHISLQFGGDSAVTYEVTLRVRGIMEGYWYSGGTLDSTSKTFYTGGVPTIGGYSSACKNKTSELPFALPAEMTPTDNCWNGFNVLGLVVAEPKQHYFLNYTANKNGDRPPHAVYSSDYTVTIAIKGQATLDFYIVGSDEHECYNFDRVVDGVSLKPTPYIGEFAQFDVTGVTRVP
jgi:hypothetical protein